MRDATSLPEAGLEWLEADGPFADVVLSTRVRLARNLEAHRFGLRADEQERQAILQTARDAAQRTKALGEGTALSMRRVHERTRRTRLPSASTATRSAARRMRLWIMGPPMQNPMTRNSRMPRWSITCRPSRGNRGP